MEGESELNYQTHRGQRGKKHLRQNPIEDGAISGFSGQKFVPE